MTSLCAWSAQGSTAAHAGADGHVRVWNTSSSSAAASIKTQRPADLSDPVTCMVWPAMQSGAKSGKRKKGSKEGGAEEADFILIGTEAGKIHLLSTTTGVTQALCGSHGGRVTCAAFNPASGSVYTAGADLVVMEWDVKTRELLSKWTPDKRAVTAMTVVTVNDKQALVTAASQIKIWDLETKEEIKRISGHEYSISQVLPVLNNTHVLSCVHAQPEDAIVNLWPLGGDKKEKKASASFSSPAAPQHIDAVATGDASLRILVVDTAGAMHVYDYTSNGDKAAKPHAPKASVRIVSNANAAAAVPILSATFDRKSTVAGGDVVIARGSWASPVFETLTVASEDGEMKDLVLKRDAPVNLILNTPKPASGPSSSQPAAAVTMLGAADSVAVSSKVKKSRGEDTEPLLEEQLEALGVASSGSNSGGVAGTPKAKGNPKAGTLVQMLTQALHSKDNALLEECLNTSNENIVKNTVSKLPPKYVVQFLTDVVNRFQSKPSRGVSLLVWIKSILTLHTAYLMTVPQLTEVIAGLYSMIDARVSVFPRLLKLSGRLDLMLSHITEKSKAEAEDESTQNEPVVTYKEQDSEDEFNMLDEDMASSEEDEEEGWEDEVEGDEERGEEEEDEEEEDVPIDMDEGSEVSEELDESEEEEEDD